MSHRHKEKLAEREQDLKNRLNSLLCFEVGNRCS